MGNLRSTMVTCYAATISRYISISAMVTYKKINWDTLEQWKMEKVALLRKLVLDVLRVKSLISLHTNTPKKYDSHSSLISSYLIYSQVWIRRYYSSTRKIYTFSRQVSSKPALFTLQSLNKTSGGLSRLQQKNFSSIAMILKI